MISSNSNKKSHFDIKTDKMNKSNPIEWKVK